MSGKFRITGNVRFLSHQETMRVIARAIIRSGIEPVYSEGFNPHLKLSLPLPRNVGLASEDELFCVKIKTSEHSSFKDSSKNVIARSPDEIGTTKQSPLSLSEQKRDCFVPKGLAMTYKDSLAKQLPEGFELVSIDVTEKRVSYQPVEVEYFIKVNLPEKQEQIRKINEQIQAGDEILIERTVNQDGDIKIVNVAKYLRPFEPVENGVRVFCSILPTGTIRPDEILRLLDIDSSEISCSIIRKKVNWQVNE